jgi:hypothetical protein
MEGGSLMSWNRRIKVLYSIGGDTFLFIIWSIFAALIFGSKPDYRLYIAALAASFFLQFLISKLNKRKIAVITSMVVGIALVFFISSKSEFFINSIFIALVALVTNSTEDEEIIYNAFKDKAKKALLAAVFTVLLIMFVDLEIVKDIFRFYIVLLISIVILLRETRNYAYSIRNKKGISVNIGLAAGILVLSSDFVFQKVVDLLKLLIKIIDIPLSLVLNLLGILMKVPLDMMMNYFRKKHLQNPDVFDLVSGGDKNQPPLQPNLESVSGLPVWLSTGLKLIILLIVIYTFYKLILKFRYGVKKKEQFIVEERERITSVKEKDSFIKRTIKRLLNSGDLRSQVLSVYKKFQEKTYEKGIFKRHMTARQLKNVTKTRIDNPEGIDSLTDIYNEVKFSNHHISDEKLSLAKESFNKIKKQL